MSRLLGKVRSFLRKRPLWVRFQELNREGWFRAWQRRAIQRLILATPPVKTATTGPAEVRVLTWRRDWMNQLWALKTFYHFAGVDYPLHIHDGGLDRGQGERLLAHFPNARFVAADEALTHITKVLTARRLPHCLEFRRNNPFGVKLIDYFAFSTAQRVVSIDSDILFFRRPDELLDADGDPRRNLFNRDVRDWYCLEPERLEGLFGIRPPAGVNAGLSLIWRESVDLNFVEHCLARMELPAHHWLTEQTVHAINSKAYGIELLPDTYCVGEGPLPAEQLVCKHYPGPYRPQMYAEGMRRLVGSGFLERLRDRVRPNPACSFANQ
jgi:hypothetical protein